MARGPSATGSANPAPRASAPRWRATWAAASAWVVLALAWTWTPSIALKLWGFLAMLAAIAAVGVLARGRPVVRRRPGWTGAAWMGAGVLGLALAETARRMRIDPPSLDAATLPPLLAVGASALFLVGAWRLFEGTREGPACARCARPVTAVRCPACGALLA